MSVKLFPRKTIDITRGFYCGHLPAILRRLRKTFVDIGPVVVFCNLVLLANKCVDGVSQYNTVPSALSDIYQPEEHLSTSSCPKAWSVRFL